MTGSHRRAGSHLRGVFARTGGPGREAALAACGPACDSAGAIAAGPTPEAPEAPEAPEPEPEALFAPGRAGGAPVDTTLEAAVWADDLADLPALLAGPARAAGWLKVALGGLGAHDVDAVRTLGVRFVDWIAWISRAESFVDWSSRAESTASFHLAVDGGAGDERESVVPAGTADSLSSPASRPARQGLATEGPVRGAACARGVSILVP